MYHRSNLREKIIHLGLSYHSYSEITMCLKQNSNPQKVIFCYTQCPSHVLIFATGAISSSESPGMKIYWGQVTQDLHFLQLQSH